ncbi:MAG: glycosyltransferase family 4 protein [Deltaproteobacteria bacterium]|nr:glycosyltransferase family 4 protein [Deltaproteobacteria bacterium]
MNILHTEWSNGWGGQEQRIVLESRLFKERGHQVLIATRAAGELFFRAHREGITTIPVPFRKSMDFSSMKILRKIIKAEKIDLVVTHSSVDSWVAAGALFGQRDAAWVRMRHLSIPPAKNPFNLIYQRPDLIITTSESIAEMLIRTQKLDKTKVVSVPTGVDLSRFKPEISGEKVRGELGLESREIMILYAAVLRSWKRHDLVLDAFRKIETQLPTARLIFAGEGPQRENIQRRIADLGLKEKVILMGHREDVPEVIAAAEICILASDRGEGVPQAVGQYLAMRKPVIAANVGGVSELIIPGMTGWLVDPGSVNAIAEALVESAESLERLKGLGMSGRELVEMRWGAETMAEKLESLYQRCIEQKRRK